MLSHFSRSGTVSLIAVFSLVLITAGGLFAQDFPYKARVTGDEVNVRSGPGTNYYRCTQLNEGDIVTVVAEQFNWSRILPLEDSFCWIAQEYVDVNPEDMTGTVTGDSVRVWAGSEFLRPIRSSRLQLKLNEGDKVELLGEQADGYYKIAAPTGSYFWISSDYIEPYQPAEEPNTPDLPDEVEVGGEVEMANQPQQKPVEPAEPEETTEPEQEVQTPAEKGYLERFNSLRERIEAERQKPAGQQDYSAIKSELSEIASSEDAGKASRYAEVALERIERIEFALNISDALSSQQKQLNEAMKRIEQAKQEKMSEIGNLGKYAVIGEFQESNIYGQDYYKVVDAEGDVICYALPEGGSGLTNAEKYISRKVGLIGEIQPHPETKEAMVKFTGIEILD